MNQFRIQAIINTHENVTHATMDKAFDVNNLPVLINEDKVIIEMNRMQDEYDAQAYARSRKAEYPTIQDVTVALAEKTEGDSTMWDEITAKRAAIKTKYPKP